MTVLTILKITYRYLLMNLHSGDQWDCLCHNFRQPLRRLSQWRGVVENYGTGNPNDLLKVNFSIYMDFEIDNLHKRLHIIAYLIAIICYYKQ